MSDLMQTIAQTSSTANAVDTAGTRPAASSGLSRNTGENTFANLLSSTLLKNGEVAPQSERYNKFQVFSARPTISAEEIEKLQLALAKLEGTGIVEQSPKLARIQKQLSGLIERLEQQSNGQNPSQLIGLGQQIKKLSHGLQSIANALNGGGEPQLTEQISHPHYQRAHSSPSDPTQPRANFGEFLVQKITNAVEVLSVLASELETAAKANPIQPAFEPATGATTAQNSEQIPAGQNLATLKQDLTALKTVHNALSAITAKPTLQTANAQTTSPQTASAAASAVGTPAAPQSDPAIIRLPSGEIATRVEQELSFIAANAKLGEGSAKPINPLADLQNLPELPRGLVAQLGAATGQQTQTGKNSGKVVNADPQTQLANLASKLSNVSDQTTSQQPSQTANNIAQAGNNVPQITTAAFPTDTATAQTTTIVTTNADGSLAQIELSAQGTQTQIGSSTANPAAARTFAGNLPGQINMPNLAFEMTRQFANGNSRFAIRLDPPEMGRIDIRMEIDQNGAVTARLSVEKSETLDYLQRDARTLERALADSGFKSSETNLEFSLKGQNRGRDQDQQMASDWTNNANGDDDTMEATASQVMAYTGTVRPGGINLLA